MPYLYCMLHILLHVTGLVKADDAGLYCRVTLHNLAYLFCLVKLSGVKAQCLIHLT